MLKGKIAVVTGASRGIGRAIAVKLAAEGAVVIINYNRSKDEAEKVKEQIHPVRIEKKPAVPVIVSDAQKAEDETEMDDRTRSLIASALSAFRSRG